jgi:hypothetical protein
VQFKFKIGSVYCIVCGVKLQPRDQNTKKRLTAINVLSIDDDRGGDAGSLTMDRSDFLNWFMRVLGFRWRDSNKLWCFFIKIQNID